MLSENDTIPPHFEAHRSYISIHRKGICGYVHTIDAPFRCDFVMKTPECSELNYLIDYMKFLFCDVPKYELGIAIIVFWFLFLILVIHCVIIKCYYPAFIYLCKQMKLSEHLAAFTFLAIGNYTPNIVYEIYMEAKTLDTEIVYNEVMGSALFVTTVVVGIIMWNYQFYIVRSFFIIQMIYSIVVIFTIWLSNRNSYQTIYETISLALLPVFFSALFIGLHKVYAGQVKKYYVISQGNSPEEAILANMSVLVSPIKIYDKNGIVIEDEDLPKFNTHGDFENWSQCRQFLEGIKPFSREQYMNGNCLKKLYYIIRTPVWVILSLLIPNVNHNLPWHGWSKVLNLINFILFPTVFFLTTNLWGFKIAGVFPVYAVVLLIMYIVISLLFLLSDYRKKPKLHFLFAPYTYMVSVILIYISITELVSCCDVFGIILRTDHTFLGITIVSWGYSLLDLNANLCLASQGYHTMALLACYTGPIFNVILTLTITFVFKFVKEETLNTRVRDGQHGQNCTIFFFLTLIFTFFGMSIINFQARRSFAVFLLTIYFIFFTFIVLVEHEVIHAYGTDHVEERPKFTYFGIIDSIIDEKYT